MSNISLPFNATKESVRQKQGKGYLMLNTLLSVTYIISRNELIQNYNDIWSPVLSKCFLISPCNIRCFISGPISHSHNSSPSEFSQSHYFCCQETAKKQELIEEMVNVIICDFEKLSPTQCIGMHR